MKIVISRQMRQALLISLLWHLFCISFVSIIFTPKGFKRNKYFSVYFLGSILNGGVSFPESQQALHNDSVKLPSEADIQIGIAPFNEGSDISFSEQKKIVDPDSIIDLDYLEKEAPALTNLGPLKRLDHKREIIFRPEFPKYPEWVQQDFRASFIVFNVYISAEGLVEQLICLQASGNPEIDVTLARYIERWRFAPASSQQGEWQKVKIDLQANG